MDQVKIGKYLKCLRKEKGLTQAHVAEQLLRIIQSIPSKKAEPFKLWLAC